MTIGGVSVYTAAQAASVCGVSVRTVQRKFPQLEAAGAWKDGAGQWHIPVEAMRSAGLSPGRPTAPDSGGDMSLRHRDNVADTVSHLSGSDVVEELRSEVAEWRRRAEVAEAQAAERERVIEAQRMALKMLETAPIQPPAERTPEPATPGGLLARFLRF